MDALEAGRVSYSSQRDGDAYVVKWGCMDCGHKWTRRYVTDAPYDIKRPACPACKKRAKQTSGLQDIITSGRAPSIGGTSIQNKALDATAEMVMHDYGLTDIKTPTEIRHGEAQAPKIHPRLQAQADSMFSPQRALAGTGMDKFAGAIARSAMGGAFSPKFTGSPDPVSVVQSQQRQQDLMARTTILNEKKNG